MDAQAPAQAYQEQVINLSSGESTDVIASSFPEVETYGFNVYSEFPIVIDINKTTQRMHVYRQGKIVKVFKVSTGREEWEKPRRGERYVSTTPNGWYAPQRYVEKYVSKSWGSTMRYSIFFTGGIAIHATSPLRYPRLGDNASHGCVRLTRANAKWLWHTARSEPKTLVPKYTRSGKVLTGGDGQVKRHLGSPVLIIVRG